MINLTYTKRWRQQFTDRLDAKLWLSGSSDPAGLVASLLFELNRQPRTMRTMRNRDRKQTIYRRKTALIEWFYRHGYVETITVQSQTLACWHTWDYNNAHDDYCERCDNTGIYRQTRLYCFHVKVGNRQYRWHQPEAYVSFLSDSDRQATDAVAFEDLPEYTGDLQRPSRLLSIALMNLYLATIDQFTGQPMPSLIAALKTDIRLARGRLHYRWLNSTARAWLWNICHPWQAKNNVEDEDEWELSEDSIPF